jgi:hypothetical protein
MSWWSWIIRRRGVRQRPQIRPSEAASSRGIRLSTDAFPHGCPYDGSPLRVDGGSRPKADNPALRESRHYCPNCGIVFLALNDSTEHGGSLQILQWRIEDGRVIPGQPDEEGLRKLDRELWEWYKALVNKTAAAELRAVPLPCPNSSCPNDGMMLRGKGPVRIGNNPWLWLTWCPWCGIGDVWRRTGHHSWEPVLAVRYDRVRDCYEMTKHRGDQLDVEALARRLRESPPQVL